MKSLYNFCDIYAYCECEEGWIYSDDKFPWPEQVTVMLPYLVGQQYSVERFECCLIGGVTLPCGNV